MALFSPIKRASVSLTSYPFHSHVATYLSAISPISKRVSFHFCFQVFCYFSVCTDFGNAVIGCINYSFFALFNTLQVLGLMFVHIPQFWRVLIHFLFLTHTVCLSVVTPSAINFFCPLIELLELLPFYIFRMFLIILEERLPKCLLLLLLLLLLLFTH